MTKKLLTVLAVLLVAILAFAGCGSEKWGPVAGAAKDDAVVGNGGFLVEKGNYIYFINGAVGNTVDNTFGTPVQGAIVVADKSDLTKEAKVVVPKAIAAGDKTAGIYIFGEWIYYATPNSNKDKDGAIQHSYLDFCRTKLDGTVTETALYTSSNATAYRYVEVNGTVYLVYYDTANKDVISYNFSTKTSTVIADEVGGYVFSTDENYPSVYYSKVVTLDEENDFDASYNKVYKVPVAGGDAVEVLSGVPKGTDASAASSTGLVFTLLAHQNGMLIYTCKYVDGSTFRGGYALLDKDVTENAIANAETKARKLSALETNFTSSIVIGFDEAGNNLGYIYKDAERGLIKYVYETNTYTRISTCTTTTLVSVKDGYVYFTDGTNFVRLSVDTVDASKADAQVISANLYSTTWYKPEFIGNEIYFASNTYGVNYISRADLTATEIKPQMVGVYTAKDKETVEKKMEEEAEKEAENN